MHRSPASQRRRAKVRRRDQIRRRRAVTLAVLVTLIVLAVWAAYAIPGQTPARVPQSAAMPTVDGSPAGAGDVVVAQVEGLDFVLPVAREVTTAVAYHPVDNADTVPFAPAGDRLSGGSLGQKLAAIFAGGGAIQYYLMDGADVQARGRGRTLAAGAVHEVVLDGAAAGEDVGELLAQATPAQAVAGRRERHGVGVVHRVIGHGRRDLAGDRQDEVEALDLRDDDIAGAGRAAVDGGHGGALRQARRGLPGDGGRGPHGEDDEGHENGQRNRTPAPDLIAAACGYAG